jgi:hypothetical protein
MTRRNEYLDIVRSELDEAGIEYEITSAIGGRHIKVWWVCNGIKRVCVVPGTPSDHYKGLTNKRCEIRRLLRADGGLV